MVLYAPQRIVPESGLELGTLSSVVLHATAKPILRGLWGYYIAFKLLYHLIREVNQAFF